MTLRSALYGIILSLLFHRLNSSCFIFSDLCGFGRSISNELDSKVHDPSRCSGRNLRPDLSDNHPVQTQSGSAYDFLELKSILKNPKSINNQNQKETWIKRVSFLLNSDGIAEKSDEPTSDVHIPISFSNRRTTLNGEGSCAIFDKAPSFDYELEDGETVNDLITKMDLPYEIVELIRCSYPGLGHFRVNSLDLAGLILFATYFNHPEKYFKTCDLKRFFDNFLIIFPFSFLLIQSQSIKLNQQNFNITKMRAFDRIHIISHKYSLYYTLEAFYKIFGNGNPDVLIKESIKEGDMKIFFRYLKEKFIKNSDKLTTYPDKLVFWSLKYGNEQVYLNFIDVVGSIQNVKNHFNIPIICHVAAKGFYFDGIVDLLLEFEDENFDEALLLSISNGNHKLFKDLIKYENSLFDRYHDPRILNVLRSIFYNQVIEIDFIDLLEEIIKELLLLNSDDPLIISSFKSILNHLNDFECLKDLLLISLFLETRDYFEIIVETFPMNYLLLIDYNKISIWELVHDSLVYFNVLETLITTNSFNILHAIGNLEFPKELWSQVIEKCKNPQFNDEEIEFKELAFIYGFNEDIMNQLDLISLGLSGKRIWSLLELSIMCFNSDAVEVILEKFPIDYNQKESIINLAKSLNDLVDSNHYKMTHPMNSLLIKKMTLDNFRKNMPEFYFKDIQAIDTQKYVAKLSWNINCIRRALLR